MHKRPMALPWSQIVLDEIQADHERCHDEYQRQQEQLALSRVPTLFDAEPSRPVVDAVETL